MEERHGRPGGTPFADTSPARATPFRSRAAPAAMLCAMAADAPSRPGAPARSRLAPGAWVVMLAASALPRILVQELGPGGLEWVRPAQLAALLAALAATWLVERLRRLRLVVAIFLIVHVAEWVVFEAAGRLTPMLRGDGGFVSGMAAVQAPRLTLALVVIAAALPLFGDRRRFFLARGDLAAPAAPIRGIGMLRPTRWNRLAPILTLCLAGGTVTFLTLAGGAPLGNLAAAVPLLPFVLGFAAINAFGEEVTYRAPQLAGLQPVVGATHGLLITAAYFGIAHYYGVPYGIIGVVMSAALGWLLGRSMLETRGLFWAWFIHFVMDVAIFTFLAAGSVTPGGG